MAESSANVAEEQPQQLSLRVMRLSKPSLAGSSTIVEPGERLGEALRQLDLEDPNTPALPDPDELLMLPAAFGSIYLGEVFSGYLCRIALVDTSSEPIKVLAASQTSEHVVVHEIKELGIHILVCSVQYLSLTGDGREERRFFRRFYKFQTKVNSQTNERVFLEVQVQNLTVSPMCLDRINLEAAEGFISRDLNLALDGTGQESVPDEERLTVFGDTEFLQPQDVRQYLFLLTLNPNINDAAAAVRSSDALGKLDIRWRTTFGEFGRLQTSQLTRRLPALERIQIATTRVDAPVVVEKPFNIEFRITNRSDAQMRLQLSAVRTRMGSVLLNGQASRLLGELEPGTSMDVTLEFLSLASGLHPVGGLKLTDLIGGETKTLN
ncbi:hypothetical protein BDF19DRAFT_421497 [Syncephalis fuscata]|nr:hypothetical protein BDF19DRAFT_421497 [Syncephalis fuscata]